jgi:16S rRNA (cytidine1402-2'-O)-methyltransferase
MEDILMKSKKSTGEPQKSKNDAGSFEMQKPVSGILYLVATPIGNLEDISLRALRILKEADMIAAEDTRHTLKLLNHYGIKKPLTSYHEHNIREKGRVIVQSLLSGNNIAVVSDAGSPGISDPGSELVSLAIENGITVTMAPGPAALVPGLVLSGLDAGKFVFEGFLPVAKKARREILASLLNEKRTMVFYEAPHKLRATLNDFFEVFGDRKISLARELTKKFEEVIRCRLSEAVEIYRDSVPKGEFVIAVEGRIASAKPSISSETGEIKIIFDKLISAGIPRNEAVKKTAEEVGMTRRDVYTALLKKEKTL